MWSSLSSPFADSSLQLGVRRAEVVVLRLRGLDLLALPRAESGGRKHVLLAKALSLTVGRRRAG